MCGIAGVINYQAPGENLQKRARLMQSRLLHRGPDAQAERLFPNAALTHTRLALIDEAGGAQPFLSPDGRYALVYNGEIYNYKELRRELEQDWPFRSRSDTEVLLAAYILRGPKILPKLNGMFSFFIWDSELQEGFGARDLLGIKPFVYSRDGNDFLFASEAKAILAARSSGACVDQESLLEYLVAPYFSGVERTMFAGIENLQPGHYLKINRAGIQTAQWGDYELKDELIRNPDVAELMHIRLNAAVDAAMVSDVPLGSYLSGGFDSTLITAIASRQNAASLETFTVKFENQSEYDYENSLIVLSDDTPYAMDAARDLKLKHNLVQVDREMIGQSLKEIAGINDALPAWEQEIAQHFLARRAAKHFKAVLVGDGADETHYGYQFLLDQQATSSPSGILNRFSLPPLREGLLENPLEYFNAKYRKLTEDAGHSWNTPLERYLATTYLIVKRWLPRLLHNGDIHSMNYSLEARVPFGDTNLLELARRIHPEIGYKSGTEKWLLRRSARGLMPESNRIRKKSALPKDQEMEAVYKHIAARAFKKNQEFLENFFDVNAVMEYCKPEKTNTEQELALLFRIIALCNWSETYGVNVK